MRAPLALLILMAMITALSVDIYMPSMPGLATYFGTDEAGIQWTLSLFVVAFAGGQLFLGPLSDRFGRKPVLLAGLILYLIGNIFCALSNSLLVLLISRVVQGLGACAGTVICFAIVRDQYEARERTSALAQIATASALAPILAPIVGAWLDSHFSWRASFLFLAGVSLILIVLSALFQPETNKHPMSLSFGNLIKNYLEPFSNGTFRAYCTVNAMAFTGLFAFLSSSSFLFIKGFGCTPETFAILFGSNAVLYMVGSLITSRLSRGVYADALLPLGCFIMLGAGILMMCLVNVASYWAVLVPMYLATFGIAFSYPSSISGAMEPFPKTAGLVSALLGFIRFVAGAVVGVALSQFSITHGGALGVSLILTSAIALMAYFRVQPKLKHDLAMRTSME